MEEKLKVLNELLAMVNDGEFEDWARTYVADAYIELEDEEEIEKKVNETLNAVVDFLESRIIEEEEPLTD